MSHSPASMPKRKNFPIRPDWAWLDRALQSCVAILAINWVFQGMRGMQRKELGFRLALGAVVAIPCAMGALLAGVWEPMGVLVGVAAGHSCNFLFNGQFWVCARYCRGYRGSAAVIAAATSDLAHGLAALPWLEEVAFIGSRARGGRPSDRSDIDVRIVFPDGIGCWWRTNLLLLNLRTRALFSGLPLDLYAYDRPDALCRFDQDEPLLLAKDSRGRLTQMFRDRVVTLQQWREAA